MISTCIGVFLVVAQATNAASTTQFGHDMLQYFAFSPNYTNLNFGSYGAAPLEIIEYQNNLRMHIESCPDCWMRYERYTAINQVQKQIADYLGIKDWNDLVFTINASHGVNTVLRSISEKMYNHKCSSNNNTNNNNNNDNSASKCKFLYLSIAYEMVKDTINHMTSDAAFNENEMGIQVNVTKEMLTNNTLLLNEIEKVILAQIADFTKTKLDKNRKNAKNFNNNNEDDNNPIILASFSHIASKPGIILPIKDIISLCHKYNIPVLIDGAHAMGHINVNISSYTNDYEIDFYLTNGHKWLYSSHGSSILYINKKYQNIIYPLCISNEGQGNTSYQKLFSYQGTNDDTPWMTMKQALIFRNKYNDSKIIKYINDLAIDAGILIKNLWNTSIIGDAYNGNNENYNIIPALVNIELPTQNQTEIMTIESMLYNDYFTYVPMFEFDGIWYARLSAQIFLEISDFQWFAQLFLSLLDKIAH